MKVNMTSSMPGCVFEYCGRVPEAVYKPEVFRSPLEQAVYKNDLRMFKQLVREGHEVSVKLKIGQMSCIEFAAMRGLADILRALLDDSINANTLRQYFSLADVVERAYLISHNKSIFFEQEALAEANRYEAALYTAIEYNQPQCVDIMLQHLGNKELGKHNFYTKDTNCEQLTAAELAQVRGHSECYNLLVKRNELKTQ